MKKIKKILHFVLILCTFSSAIYSQTIVGKVIEKDSQNPIPNASVRIGKRGIITDSKGNFTLKLKEQDWEQNIPIRVTSVGFKSFSVPIKSFKNGVTIHLESQNNELQEVIVSSSAKEIVQKALDAIPINYYQKPFVILGKFLETNKRSKTDTIFVIDYDAKTQMSYDIHGSQNTKVELISYNKKKYLSDTAKYIKWYNDGKVLEYFDYVFSKGYFFKESAIEKYKFTLQDIVPFNNRSTYLIKFELKRNPKKLDGYVYIDEETHAFAAFEYQDGEVSETEPGKFQLGEKRQYHGKIIYQLKGDKWFLSSIDESLSAKIRNKSAYVSLNFKTNQIDTLQTKLALTYKNSLTKNMMMEELEREFSPPNLVTQNKNIENLKLLRIGKKIRFSVKNNISVGLLALTPQFIHPINDWQQFYGISPRKQEAGNSINLQYGVMFVFEKFNFTTQYARDINFNGYGVSSSGIEISKYIHFKNQIRPNYIRPAIGSNLNYYSENLGAFQPSTDLQLQQNLNNEPYLFIQQSQILRRYIGINYGIHLTRTRILEIGFNYHFAREWESELVFRKNSNTWLQDLFWKNSTSIPLPFQIISKVPNQLSFHVNYHFL